MENYQLKKTYPSPEVWGGIECTINRIGNEYRDQLEDGNYYRGEGYINQIMSLGIKMLRFPVLWEHHVKYAGDEIDWSWAAQELEQLRAKGIKPIAGLLHHGSGPMFTDLSDADFPAQLAGYAKQVAERFSWIEYYTPVNEPLTTARFSGLYGHWYPHHSDAHSFLTMLLNQVKGVVLSMRAIRQVNPAAKLVQTEDLCRVHGVPELQYQCDFENERCWLTNDLLCGIVDEDHPLWNYFMEAGITKKQLDFFVDNPCPPDIAGYNYYITSERFLDTALSTHPHYAHGGNDQERYADVAAVHMVQRAGVKALLAEAWDRYRIPLALTEVHLGCSCDEQMRWFNEIYQEASNAAAEGIDIRGVTAWALLGSFDWNSLLTRKDMVYECGAFELKAGECKETALGQLIRSIALGQSFDGFVFEEKGWWQKIEHDEKPVYAQEPAQLTELSFQ